MSQGHPVGRWVHRALDVGAKHTRKVVRASPHYLNTTVELDRLVEIVADDRISSPPRVVTDHAPAGGTCESPIRAGGGLLLLFNWNTKYAALALAVYTLVIGAIFHGFWRHWGDAPPVFVNEVNHFLKNLGVAGGLLLLASQISSERTHVS